MNTSLTRILPFVFACAFFIQGYFGSLSKSLTWDEPVFIASGYSYLTRHDFRMNAEAPPLLQQLQALPLLSLNLNQIDTNHPIWQKAEHIVNGQYFIQANAQKLTTLTKRARTPMLILGALLVLALYFWAQKLYGTTPALWTTALASCSPNLLAHAKLATTDLGCAAFMFFATFAFYLALHNPTIKTWILCGITTGLALLTKYTALLLGPVFILLGLFYVWHKKITLKNLLIGAGIVLLTVTTPLIIGYQSFSGPLLYLQGLQKIYANANVGYQFYLLGKVSDQPFWYYYFVAFLVKTPIATGLLIGLSLYTAIRQQNNRDKAFFSLIPIGLMFLISCFDQSNLGYRRILPALPFLLLFCAHTFSASHPNLLKKIVPALVALACIESLSIYPHHLSFFNQAVGGPIKGPYLLDDSNIDWGQDLPGLAQWQKNHPNAQPLRQLYFGIVPPHLYGIQSEKLPLNTAHIRQPQPGYYAISAHNLAWFRKIKKQHNLDIDWLTKYHPIDHIGYSIYIYHFPQSAQ